MIGQLFQRKIAHPLLHGLYSFAVFGLVSQHHGYQTYGAIFKHLTIVIPFFVRALLYAVVIPYLNQVGPHGQHQLTGRSMIACERVNHYRYTHLVGHQHLLVRLLGQILQV